MQKIAIIGCGKVGSSLFRAVKNANLPVTAVVDPLSRDDETARYISQNIYFNQITASIIGAGEIIIIAAPDDQVSHIAGQLAQFEVKHKYIIHTSGFLDDEPLFGLRESGASVASFHPLQTFSRRFENAEIWNDIICTIQGDPQVQDYLEDLCKTLGAKSVRVSSQQKKALHLAGVVSANYVVALLGWAEELLKDAGLSEPQPHEWLQPMLSRITERFRGHSAADLLSGPLQRGDVQTIQGHLQYLKNNRPRAEYELYADLARSIIEHPDFQIRNRDQLKRVLK